MKTKKLFITAIFLAAFFQTNAQIENEIRTYVDSTEILLNNGRRLLMTEVRDMNYTKVSEIYNYLNLKTSTLHCEAFTYNEHLFIALLTSDWDTFLDKAENVAATHGNLCYRHYYIIESELYEALSRNYDRIRKAIYNANLNKEDADLLDIYLYVLQYGKSEEIYNRKLKEFKKSYPDSPYNDFVIDYLPLPSGRPSMTISMGPEVVWPQGNLRDYFKPSIGVLLSWDFCIDRIYSSLYLSTSKLGLRENTDKEASGFTDDNSFIYFQGGLKGGYFMLRNKRFHLAPYINIGGASLNKKMIDDKKEQQCLLRSFYLGPGIHSEIKLYEYQSVTPGLYGYSAKGYISLKLDAGYNHNFIIKQSMGGLKGNVFYTTLTLTWGIGIF